MPWQWGSTPTQSIEVGGKVGGVNEAKQSGSWPNYEAAYLAKRLGSVNPTSAYTDKYNGNVDIDQHYQKDVFDGMDSTQKAVYLNTISKDYKTEADECLKKEFADWLQGRHEDNLQQRPYFNKAGKPPRRWVYRGNAGKGGGQGSGVPGETMDRWTPTWWGQGSLAFLPGVREYLRKDAEASDEESYRLNILAEHGPQNLEDAWAYFKHWVKGRPLSDAVCLHESAHPHTQDNEGRAPIGDVKPDEFYNPPRPEGNKPDDRVNLDTDEPMWLAESATELRETRDDTKRYEIKYARYLAVAAKLSGIMAKLGVRVANAAAGPADYMARNAAEGTLSYFGDLLAGLKGLFEKNAEGEVIYQVRTDRDFEELTMEVEALLFHAEEAAERAEINESQQTWMASAEDAAIEADNDVHATARSYLETAIEAVTPGPVMNAVGRAAFQSARAGTLVAANAVEGAALATTTALTSLRNTTSDNEEFNGTQQGFEALGFRPRAQVRREASSADPRLGRWVLD